MQPVYSTEPDRSMNRLQLNSNSKYNITLKAPPELVCMKNTTLGGMSRDKYSTRLRLVLYLSLNMPPRAVFSVQHSWRCFK